MHLINCKINIFLTWSNKYVLSNATVQGTKFEITNTKLCITAVILSIQDNVKILQQLISGFKITINWNKYQ